MVGIGLARDRRLAVAALAVCAGIIVIPIVVNVASAASAGLIWQGRYSLPLFAMLGMLGMFGWHRHFEHRPDERLLGMVRWGAAACFVVAEVGAFWQCLRRFTVGSGGKIWLTDPLPWQPSIAPMPLIAINAVLVTVFALIVLHGTAEPQVGDVPHPGSVDSWPDGEATASAVAR